MKHPRLLSLLTLTTLSLGSPWAQAQPVAPVIQALLSPQHTSVRLHAARDIARTHPEGGRQALERTLADSANAPRVRAAAALGLGELGDTAALPALNRHAAEPNRRVLRAVRRALLALHSPNSPPLAPCAPPTDWRRVGTLVSLGMIVHRAPEALAYDTQFRSALERELASLRGIGFVGAHPSREAAARIARGRLRRFTLEGGVARLRHRQNTGMVEVRAEVSLMVMSVPAHTILGTIEGSSAASEPLTANGPPSDISTLTLRAIEGALHSSVSHLSQELGVSSPARPARHARHGHRSRR